MESRYDESICAVPPLPRVSSFLHPATHESLRHDLEVSSKTFELQRPPALMLPGQRTTTDPLHPHPSPVDLAGSALATFRSLQDGKESFKTPRLTPLVRTCRSEEEDAFYHPRQTPLTRAMRAEQEAGFHTGLGSTQAQAIRAEQESFIPAPHSLQLDLLIQSHEDPFDHHHHSSSSSSHGRRVKRGSYEGVGTPPQSSPININNSYRKAASILDVNDDDVLKQHQQLVIQEEVRREMEGFPQGGRGDGHMRAPPLVLAAVREREEGFQMEREGVQHPLEQSEWHQSRAEPFLNSLQ